VLIVVPPGLLIDRFARLREASPTTGNLLDKQTAFQELAAFDFTEICPTLPERPGKIVPARGNNAMAPAP
jgi:hypothetical protein